MFISFGNAGGGITYFIMPAVFDSLVIDHGMSDDRAWRVTFIVPLVCLIACGTSMFLVCPETPMGSWKDRAQKIQDNLAAHGVQAGEVVDVPGQITERPADGQRSASDEEKGGSGSDRDVKVSGNEYKISRTEALETAKGETVVKPSFKEALPVMISPQTIFHVVTYACSFGGELAVNSILSAYYKKNFPDLDQTTASNYAAIFGFLNFVTRPMGGVVGDVLYNYLGKNLWYKKFWIVTCGILTGTLLIVIGQVDPSEANGSSIGTLVGLISVMAIFHEAGNGANFALVPHVHPFANGILSGLTGAGGNLGGVIFAIIFRFMNHGQDFAMGFWVIGIMHIGLNLAVCWIHPLPKGQIGGH
jgi:MFS transporter, NNP family, nitrate/nitrite transporter